MRWDRTALWTLRLLGAFECLLGVLVLIVPGVWQEAIHPRAMGTVFYPLQAMAAGWILRGILTVWAPRRLHGIIGGTWLLEVPVSVTFWVRAGLLGPWAAPVHALRLAMAVTVLALLRYLAREAKPAAKKL